MTHYTAPNRHLSYKELCEDPFLNPNGKGDALKNITRWQYNDWATGASVEELLDNILMDHGWAMTGVIGAFVKSEGQGGRLQVIHGLLRHRPHGNNRKKIFAYLNDVAGIDIDIVEPEARLLDVADPVTVYDTVDRQIQQFMDNEALELVPEHTAGAANTRVVTTRLSMYIPYPLVPYVIGKELTPREALTTLVPIIRELELEPHVAPLMDFLLAASTATDDGIPITVVETMGAPPDLNGAKVANERRKILLSAQLPELMPGLRPCNGVWPSRRRVQKPLPTASKQWSQTSHG